MKASEELIEGIKRFEGLRTKAYRCPAGKWTIGYGHTDHVGYGQEITEVMADSILREWDVPECEEAVLRLVNVPMTQGQFDALVDFVFNLGSKRLASSTLLKHFNSGDTPGAAGEFTKWVYAGGERLSGLVERRAWEKNLFERSE